MIHPLYGQIAVFVVFCRVFHKYSTEYKHVIYKLSTKVIHISTEHVHILWQNISSPQHMLLVFHNIHKLLLTNVRYRFA